MELRLFLNNAARFLVDPENEKNKNPKVAWAVTIILGTLTIGIPQMLCGAWRHFQPEEKNVTHEKINKLFEEFIGKPKRGLEEDATLHSPTHPKDKGEIGKIKVIVPNSPKSEPSPQEVPEQPPPKQGPLPQTVSEPPLSANKLDSLNAKLTTLFDTSDRKDMGFRRTLTTEIHTSIFNQIFQDLPNVNIKEIIESSLAHIATLSTNKKIPAGWVKEEDLLLFLVNQGLDDAFSKDNYASLADLMQALAISYPENPLINEAFEKVITREINFLKNPEDTAIETSSKVPKKNPLKALSQAIACYPKNEELKACMRTFAEDISEEFKKDFTFIHEIREEDPLALIDAYSDEEESSEEENTVFLDTSELNATLYAIRDDIPQEWLEKNLFHEVEIWLNKYKIDPLFFKNLAESEEAIPKKPVAQAIVACEKYNKNENLSLQEFIAHLRTVIGFIDGNNLLELEKKDLTLARYLLSLRASILEAADKIRPVFENAKLNLEREEDRVINQAIIEIDQALHRLLDIGLKLEVKMRNDWDVLHARLAQCLPNTNFQVIKNWVTRKDQPGTGYELERFQTWLARGGYDDWVARQFGQGLHVPPAQNCDSIYSAFLLRNRR